MLQQIHILLRVSARHQIGLPIDLKRIQEGEDHDSVKTPLQIRQNDPVEALPLRGPVHSGRLQIFTRNPQDASQPEHHRVACIFPDIAEDQHPESRTRPQVIRMKLTPQPCPLSQLRQDQV